MNQKEINYDGWESHFQIYYFHYHAGFTCRYGILTAGSCKCGYVKRVYRSRQWHTQKPYIKNKWSAYDHNLFYPSIVFVIHPQYFIGKYPEHFFLSPQTEFSSCSKIVIYFSAFLKIYPTKKSSVFQTPRLSLVSYRKTKHHKDNLA